MKDLLLNVGSGGGAAAAPAAGGAPTAGAAAAEEPAAKEEEKEEGKTIPRMSRPLLTAYQKRKNQTRIWASVSSTKNLASFLPSVPIPASTLHIHGAFEMME